ncbi:unnamed protein product [Spirodela intermedia]|uniref:Uncharacterized protein n=1 Tax=Spirodela intermedia TaxID=51605 RepID=A0A7I8L6Y2_SPIIN|nr:unnamed protein product [Spirodela intermedia]
MIQCKRRQLNSRRAKEYSNIGSLSTAAYWRNRTMFLQRGYDHQRGGEQDLSPPLHELEATKETPLSRVQPDRGTRAKMKDPEFRYTT